MEHSEFTKNEVPADLRARYEAVKEEVEPYYSIKHLIVSDDQEWTRAKLWCYNRVEKITIDGDWKYNDDDCSNFCFFLRNLREFEVINSKGTFFSEDGALYANIKRGKFSA